jgi:hypothetical protein
MQRLLLAIWICVSTALPLARAHTDEYFDKIETPHGGQIRMAGPYHLELVVGQNELTVYVTDHADQPIDTTGGSAKAIITTGKTRYVVVLASGGDNVLKGNGEFKLGKSNTISLMVALPDRDPERAKFMIKPSRSKATKPAGEASQQHQQHQHHQ